MKRVRWWMSGQFGALLLAFPCAAQAAPDAARTSAAADGLGVFVTETLRRAVDGAAEVAALLDTEAARRFDERVVVAGRPIPPGLSARRSSERRAERTAALAELEPLVTTPGSPGLAWLRALLTDTTDPVRWRAAAHVAGELGRLELAPAVGAALEEDRDPRTGAAARRVLHRLTRRWFVDVGSFRAFWTREGASAGGSFFLAPLDEAVRDGRERLIRWLGYEPTSAIAWLDDPDPETRSAVAGVVGAAIGDGRLEPREGVRALLDRSAVEADPEVFHALIEEVLAPLVGELPGTEPVARLRTILTERLESDPDGLEITLANAFARLPWITHDEGVDPDLLERAGVARGLSSFATLLESVDVAGPISDTDVMIACVQELSIVVDLAHGAERIDLLRASRARDVVAGLLRDEGVAEGVRVAAARALATFAAPVDVAILSAVFEREGSSLGLRFAILGSLQRIGADLDPEGSIAVELCRRLQAVFADPDPELRRRALALFADEDWAPLAVHLDHAALVERFGEEEVDELRVALFELIAQHGEVNHATELCRRSGFDEFATADAARPGLVVRALGQRYGGDSLRLVELAQRIEGIDDPATRAERLAAALSTLARLDDASARGLAAETHRRAVQWALDLRHFGVGLPAAAEGGGLFLRRLVEVHVEQCADVGSTGAGPCLHAKAILGSELAQLDGNAEPADLEALFQSALEYARSHQDDANAVDAWTIQRDRARVRAALERTDEALADFRAVLAGNEAALTPFDLRLAARLLEAGDDEADDAHARWAEACAWTWRLVQRTEWTHETSEQRRIDVSLLVERAIRSTDASWIERVDRLLATCPAPTDIDASPANGTVWDGLTDVDGLRAEVTKLRVQLGRTSAAPAGEESNPNGETSEPGSSSSATPPING